MSLMGSSLKRLGTYSAPVRPQEQTADASMAQVAGNVQRCPPAAVHRVRVCALGYQQLAGCLVAMAACDVERHLSVVFVQR